MKKNLFIVNSIGIAVILGIIACSEKIGGPVYPDNTGLITVTTYAPTEVTMNSAKLKIGTTLTGLGAINKRGILLVESGDPTFSDATKGIEYIAAQTSTGNNDEEVFSVNITDLKANTVYAYLGFACSESDTCYGSIKVLVTSYGTVSDAENNEYQTVKIGNQIWMRENLKATIYADNELIEGCVNKGIESSYGKHYTFKAANRVTSDSKSDYLQGACPTGWHVPGDSEWQELLSYIGMPADQCNSLGLIGDSQACKLKDAGTEFWTNEILNNITGFSILPAGITNPDKGDECIQTAFWSSTPYIYYGFQVNSEKILRGNDEPDCPCGISVRCIKD